MVTSLEKHVAAENDARTHTSAVFQILLACHDEIRERMDLLEYLKSL